MATVHRILTVGKTYAVTTSAGCTVTDGNGVVVLDMADAGQGFFVASTPEVTVSDDAAQVQEVFRHAPGGGFIGGKVNSDLNIGHAARSAVCTLTAGDMAQGGSLTDGTHTVTLAAPANGYGLVDIADATAAGTITFGEHEAIALPAKAGVKAEGYVEFVTSPGGTVVHIGGVEIVPEDGTSAESWQDAINAATACGAECYDYSTDPHIKLYLRALDDGTAGDEITVTSSEPDDDCGEGHLTGGQDARTAQEVVDAVAEAAAGYLTDVVLYADEQGFTFTETTRGDIDDVAVTGGLFGEKDWTAGDPDWTLADVVGAINGTELAPYPLGVAALAGENGTYTLTERTAGLAGNARVFTATGPFGSGETRQGSTTRGLDKTDRKILLNGDELFGESTVVVDVVEANNANAVTSNAVFNAIQAAAPHAPTPEPLGTTTTLLHGHVYTLAVAADTDLSALAVELNATAELWIDYTAGSVTWPTGLWWAEGSAPSLTAGKSYAIALRNDGVKLRANVQYEDTTPAQS